MYIAIKQNLHTNSVFQLAIPMHQLRSLAIINLPQERSVAFSYQI